MNHLALRRKLADRQKREAKLATKRLTAAAKRAGADLDKLISYAKRGGIVTAESLADVVALVNARRVASSFLARLQTVGW